MPISFYDKENNLQTVDDDYDDNGVNQAQVGLNKKGYVTGQTLVSNRNSKQPDQKIFVPDSELSQALKSGKFDLPEQVAASKTKIDVGPGEAFLRGAAQGATLGFADEASAGLGAIKDKVFNKKDLIASYLKRRNEYRDIDKSAADQNPVSSFAGNLVGGLPTALASGGAGLGSAIKTGVAMGAGSGLGSSEADNATGLAADTALGAGIGAGAPLAFEGAKKAITTLAPKVGIAATRLVTRLPDQTIERYIDRNAYVKQARPLAEIAVDAEKATGDLASRVSKGSGESRQILDSENVLIPKKKILEKMFDAKKSIQNKGVFSPTTQSELDSFDKIIDAVKNSENGTREIKTGLDRFNAKRAAIPGSKVKSLLQQLDESVSTYKKNAGDISTQSQRELTNSRKQIDELLKEVSPAYREKMLSVADDARLLQRVKPILGQKQKAYNALKRLGREQSPFEKETIQDLDAALGKGLSEEAKDSSVKEAFKKEVTNGSRNVNFFSNIPIIGPMIGYAADMSARPVAAKALDFTIKSKEFLNQNKEALGKFFTPFENATKKGPAAVLATHQMLMRDPEYRKKVSGE